MRRREVLQCKALVGFSSSMSNKTNGGRMHWQLPVSQSHGGRCSLSKLKKISFCKHSIITCKGKGLRLVFIRGLPGFRSSILDVLNPSTDGLTRKFLLPQLRL
jgi:hypothetical protein